MRKHTPLLPVEIIEQAVTGEPEAVEAVIEGFHQRGFSRAVCA